MTDNIINIIIDSIFDWSGLSEKIQELITPNLVKIFYERMFLKRAMTDLMYHMHTGEEAGRRVFFRRYSSLF